MLDHSNEYLLDQSGLTAILLTMTHSKTTIITARITIALSVSWLAFITYAFASGLSTAGFSLFSSVFFTVMIVPAILGITSGINLARRPLFTNLRHCVGVLCYTAVFMQIAWLLERVEAAPSLFIIVVLSSTLYYFISRFLGEKSGFPPQPVYTYFVSGLPTLLTFLLWVELSSICADLEYSGTFNPLFGTLCFLGVIVVSIVFYKWSSRHLTAPKDESKSAKMIPFK